ncbi:MAG: NAD-dependent epimerase/dehydratase family protein, partial [Candidatus Saccharibacteria bacterium]|nr:NAD-dependent epimerase/dehydratase family protein [Candidatus Saccharibacteria bacterium]
LTHLRLGNVYGNPKNRGFIDLVIRSLLKHLVKPITLSNDGQTLRDYIFIDDVINAILAIKNRTTHHGIINLVSGTSYSLRDIVMLIETLIGNQLPITQPAAPLVDELLAIRTSNSLLRNTFGFKIFTPLKSGLEQTLQRYQKELL